MISIPGYKITKTIGFGGMATVYLATQVSIGRQVAIKVMSPALAADPSFSDRFVKEARMANLSHPHIVTVYDAGVFEDTNYIVMEFASGENLDILIKQGISVSKSISVMKQIASALHYSCRKGFIHRDVKPENILFREDGNAVLMDFGIAKAISSGTQLTMVGSTIGSPNYMSPEQARGLELDGRSDLYSLGIVFFECLTGTKPYDSPDTYVIGLKHISEPIPVLPEELSALQPIINKLLAKMPEDRYLDGNQFIGTLTQYERESLSDVPTIQHTAVARPHEEKLTTHHTPISEQKPEPEETQIHRRGNQNVTVNANTIIDDSTRLMPDKQRHAPTNQSNIESDETVLVNLVTDNIDKSTLPTTLGPSHGSNANKTAIINNQHTPLDKTAILPKHGLSTRQQKKSSKAGIFSLLIVLLSMGGVAFWYVTQTPEIEFGTKKPDGKNLAEQESPKLEPEPKPESKPKPVPIPKVEPKVELKVSIRTKIQDILLKASDAMSKKHYTTPKNDNAFNYYQEVLRLDSNNVEALVGLDNIAERYLVLANKRFNNNKINQALKFIEKGLKTVPAHASLLALKEKITNRIFKYSSILLKDLTVHEAQGTHIGKIRKESQWFAKLDLINNLYSRMLSQCNASKNFLNRQECMHIYHNYLRQWPLPLKAVSYTFSDVQEDIKATARFEKKKFEQSYRTALRSFEKTFKQSNGKEKERILALSNYINYQSLASLLGLTTVEVDPKEIDNYLSSLRQTNPKINSLEELSNFVNKIASKYDTYLTSVTSSNSLEVTPFASKIYDSLLRTIDGAQTTASFYLYSNYDLKPDGDIMFSIWLFGSNNDLIAINSVLLDKAVIADKRKSNRLFNTDIHPLKRLKSSYGFPASIAMGSEIYNPRMLVGKSTSLNVKLDKPGFYFIAIHVVHKSDQYSYLLPLVQADQPFVQITTRDQINRYITVGDFKITPPTGVEVLQLISASVNLEKYLPDNAWDEKRQQFVIKGSEGSIRNGLAEVRNFINTLPDVTHDKTARWQERLLVTSILDN